MITRREFLGGAVAAAAVMSSMPVLAAAQEGAQGSVVDSTVDGVLLGVQSASFTFSGMGLVEIVATMRAVGLSTIDTMSEHVENFLGAPVLLPGEGRGGPWVPRPKLPPGARPNFRPFVDPEKRAALRAWRLSVDLDRFRQVSEMFTVAGLKFFSYNLSFDDSFTDEEIERGFLMTKALGTRIITASTPVELFPRLKPFAEKHDVIVALHNHVIGPDDFAKVMALSDKFWVNLDVGHFMPADTIRWRTSRDIMHASRIFTSRTAKSITEIPFPLATGILRCPPSSIC